MKTINFLILKNMRDTAEIKNVEDVPSILNVKVKNIRKLKKELQDIKNLVDSEGGNPEKSIWSYESKVEGKKLFIIFMYSAPILGKEDTSLRISATTKGKYEVIKILN